MKMCRGARWRRKRQQPLGRIEEDDRYDCHAPTQHPGCPLEHVKVCVLMLASCSTSTCDAICFN